MTLKEQWPTVTKNFRSGDFNAKIGSTTEGEDFKSMGVFKTGERRERGDRLTEFVEKHKP